MSAIVPESDFALDELLAGIDASLIAPVFQPIVDLRHGGPVEKTFTTETQRTQRDFLSVLHTPEARSKVEWQARSAQPPDQTIVIKNRPGKGAEEVALPPLPGR